MIDIALPAARRPRVVAAELAKVPAFLRRDFLLALSYRTTFVADIAGMLVQVLMFYFVGRLVSSNALPAYGGARTSYLEFVVVGIALNTFIAIGLGQVAASVRSEQLMGTLESLLVTPTAPTTIQIGSVAYQLLYVPIRTVVFLTVAAAAFGLDFKLGGFTIAAFVILVFVPFVWGLGLITAAGMLTFKSGRSGIGFFIALLGLASGVFFPLELLPNWIQQASWANPLALAIESMREALLGGAGWGDVALKLVILTPLSALSLTAGVIAFRLALRREKRLGTLGLY